MPRARRQRTLTDLPPQQRGEGGGPVESTFERARRCLLRSQRLRRLLLLSLLVVVSHAEEVQGFIPAPTADQPAELPHAAATSSVTVDPTGAEASSPSRSAAHGFDRLQQALTGLHRARREWFAALRAGAGRPVAELPAALAERLASAQAALASATSEVRKAQEMVLIDQTSSH